MLSLVTPKDPELILEPVAMLAGRSWTDYLRGQYHEQRDAPPVFVPDGATERIEKALEARARFLAQQRVAQETRLLAKMLPEWQSVKILRVRCQWSEFTIRGILARLIQDGRVIARGHPSRFSSVQYRPVLSGVSPRAGT